MLSENYLSHFRGLITIPIKQQRVKTSPHNSSYCSRPQLDFHIQMLIASNFFSTSLNSQCRPTRGHTWQNAGSELRAHWETRVCLPQESFVLSANRAIKRGNDSSPAPSAVSTKRFKTRGFPPTWGRTKTRRETPIFGASGAQRPYFKKLWSGGLYVNPSHGDQRLKNRTSLPFIYILQHCLCIDLFLSLLFFPFGFSFSPSSYRSHPNRTVHIPAAGSETISSLPS